ncbi:MAG: nitrile hydratase subunit alpha [Acidimicrobiales bacterium]
MSTLDDRTAPGTAGTGGPAAGDHRHDLDLALGALESDIEYFRTKRLEPRLLHMLRRGILSFAGLGAAGERVRHRDGAAVAGSGTAEGRVRALQDALDAYVTDVGTLTVPLRSANVVIEDVRRERGDYEEVLRIAKRPHAGSIEERIDHLAGELAEGFGVVELAQAALVAAGEVDGAGLVARREELAGQGHRNGARIVARAWVDPEFKRRLLDTGREAVRDLDIPPGRLGRLGVAENTGDLHHVVVCTLCSCYPHDLLGDPPWWYRSDEYKTRIVADPREALEGMFGLAVPEGRTVRVHDSTSDLRWMVLPRRPAGTEGWSEDALASLVTPESLVGTADARGPS